MSLLPSDVPINDRLRLISKHVKEALELDGADRPIEAYIKYLSCMQSIVQTLLDDALGRESWVIKAKARESYFRVLGETLTRASANVDLAYKKKAMMNHTIPDVSTPSIASSGSFPPPLNLKPSTDTPIIPSDKIRKNCFLTNTFSKHQPVHKSRSINSVHGLSEVDTRNRYLQQLHTSLSRDNPNTSTKISINLQMARRMEENKDLSDKRAKILHEQRERLKEETKAQEIYHMSVHQVTLKQRVETFSRRNRWIVSTQRHFRSSCHDPEKDKYAKELSSGVLRLTGHPICQILNQYQMEVFSMISSTYQKLHQAGDFPALNLTCNLSDPVSDGHCDLTESLSCSTSAESMITCSDEQVSLRGRISYGNLACIREIQSEVTGRVLKKVSEQILSKIDFLEFSLLECYLDLEPYKIICRESVEQVFLHALWVPLLSLFRCKNLDQELALSQHMISRLDDPPSAFEVPQHLCLWDDVTNFHNIPYSAAINKLKLLTEQYNLSEKISSLNESSRLIISCIDDYQKQKQIKDSSSNVGTDDLLPIVCFIVLRSCTPQLLSECEMIGSLLPENALFGETGFCLSTVQTALNYLVVRQTNGVEN
ncbi:VPS9 domain-containing protein 1 [Oopsacas minuta]|uniref:VPS9 domain-containing protein 1 n=1 Tax=Oopsacas minuta TaxID=111878 RepID=A0AAV7K065_9METZ|nr:VPS9 domain-containing protein 1 [Oopsacas minuta]